MEKELHDHDDRMAELKRIIDAHRAAIARMDRQDERFDRAETRMQRAEERMERSDARALRAEQDWEARFQRAEERAARNDARFEKRMKGFEKLVIIGAKELVSLRRAHKETMGKIDALIDSQERTAAKLQAFIDSLNKGRNGR